MTGVSNKSSDSVSSSRHSFNSLWPATREHPPMAASVFSLPVESCTANHFILLFTKFGGSHGPCLPCHIHLDGSSGQLPQLRLQKEWHPPQGLACLSWKSRLVLHSWPGTTEFWKSFWRRLNFYLCGSLPALLPAPRRLHAAGFASHRSRGRHVARRRLAAAPPETTCTMGL